MYATNRQCASGLQAFMNVAGAYVVLLCISGFMIQTGKISTLGCLGIIEYTLKQKWRWARHTSRVKDNRWTIGPNVAQSGNQGEGRDEEYDHAEDVKTT